MFKANKIAKKFVGIATISTLVLALLVPSLSFGREFNTDRSIAVYPANEVLDFGSVNVGDNVTKNFIIENTGITQKVVSVLTFPNGDFSYTGSRELVIPAQQEVALPVHFEPSDTGFEQSNFTIEAANTGERKVLTVTGNVTQNSNNGLEISASEIKLPVTPVHLVTTAEFTIKNRNVDPVSVTAAISGSSDIRLKSKNSFMLQPTETQTVVIEFNPSDEKDKSATLTLRTNAEGYDIVNIPVLGPTVDEIIIEEELEAFAELSTQSTLMSLGTVTVHEQKIESINVKNTGRVDLEIEITEEPEGPFTADAGRLNSPRTTIQPGEEGQIRVSFKPDFQGVYTSTFKVETNAINVPELVFGVSGTAVNTNVNKFDFNVSAHIGDDRVRQGETAHVAYNTNVPAKTQVRIIKDGRVVEVLQTRGSSFQKAGKSYTVNWTPENVAPGMYFFEIESVSNDGQKDSITKSIEVTPKYVSRRTIKRNPSDAYFFVPNPTINIDNGEKAYFNYFAPTRANIVYTITSLRTSRVVVQRAFATVEPGSHNYEISWDGKSYEGNKVSEGEYKFEFKIQPSNYVEGEFRIYEGMIDVVRNTSHRSTSSITTRVGSYIAPAQVRAISSYYSNNRFTELRNNENLISDFFVTPSVINNFNEEAVINFTTLHDGIATASIKDMYGNLVRKLTLNRRLVDGYHHEELFWAGDTSEGTAAVDGRYKVEVHTAQNGETDTDVAYVTLNRGHNAKPLPDFSNAIYGGQMFEENDYRNRPVNTVMPYAPSYGGTCEGFADVYGSDSFCEAVAFVVDQGIFKGSVRNGERVLRPDDYLTRAEATAVILRVMRLPILEHNEWIDGNYGFSDVDVNAWYMPHIKTIIKSATQQQTRYGSWVKNIMQGYPDGTFRPNQIMSRAEFYKVFLESAVNSAAVNANFAIDYNVTKAPFSDTAINELTEWYLPYAKWAQRYLNNTEFAVNYFDSSNLYEGVRRFKAKKGITRGEVIDLIFTTQATGLIHY